MYKSNRMVSPSSDVSDATAGVIEGKRVVFIRVQRIYSDCVRDELNELYNEKIDIKLFNIEMGR